MVTDNKTRGAVVRVADRGKTSFLWCPVQRLFPLEIHGEPDIESQSRAEDLTSTVKEQSVEKTVKKSIQVIVPRARGDTQLKTRTKKSVNQCLRRQC